MKYAVCLSRDDIHENIKILCQLLYIVSKNGLNDFTYDPPQFSLDKIYSIEGSGEYVSLITLNNYVISVSVDFEEEPRVSPFKRYIPKPGTTATRSAEINIFQHLFLVIPRSNLNPCSRREIITLRGQSYVSRLPKY